jgi:hypothetical protein
LPTAPEDHSRNKTQERINQLLEREAQKKPTDKTCERQEKIVALTRLSGLDYDAGVKAAAKELGVSRKALDQEVRRCREDQKPREQKEAEKVDLKSALDELNARHTVLENLGGKCVVMEFVRSEIHHGLLIPSYQSVDTIKNRYLNRLVYSNGKHCSLGDYWLKYPGRTQYHSLRLVPNGPRVLPGNVLNLWKGFGVIPAQGDWSLMQENLFQVLANGDHEVCEYILNWSAWCVQNPDTPAEVALVMRGQEGLGKGIFFRSLGACFGSHYLHVTSQKHVSGQFNAHLQGCIFLFADEAFAVRDKNAESILKALITEPVLMIEPKGINPFQSRNLIKVGMASNARWVIPVSHSARRYMMLDIVVRRDEAYFKALYQQVNRGGREAMLYDLLQRPLGEFHPRQIIQTEALRRQKELSMPPEDEWLESLLQDGKLPIGSDLLNQCSTAVLTDDLNKRFHAGMKEKALAQFLQDFGCTPCRTNSARGWKFPPLPEARARWERKYGKWPWHEDLKAWRR